MEVMARSIMAWGLMGCICCRSSSGARTAICYWGEDAMGWLPELGRLVGEQQYRSEFKYGGLVSLGRGRQMVERYFYYVRTPERVTGKLEIWTVDSTGQYKNAYVVHEREVDRGTPSEGRRPSGGGEYRGHFDADVFPGSFLVCRIEYLSGDAIQLPVRKRLGFQICRAERLVKRKEEKGGAKKKRAEYYEPKRAFFI